MGVINKLASRNLNLKLSDESSDEAPASVESKPDFYLNVGIMLGDRFVPLKKGLAVTDKMLNTADTSRRSAWNKFLDHQNALYEAVCEAGDSVAEGESVFLPKLVVELKRVKKTETVEEDDGETITLGSLMG